MTQFAICKIESQGSLPDDIELKPLSNDFFESMANQIFGKNLSDNCFIPIYNDLDIDALCISAQQALNKGAEFSSTLLFKFINELKHHVSDFVLWYGSDCNDLESFSDFDKFTQALETAVREPVCEAYIHFRKK